MGELRWARARQQAAWAARISQGLESPKRPESVRSCSRLLETARNRFQQFRTGRSCLTRCMEHCGVQRVLLDAPRFALRLE
eukprot:12506281-Alexandrium_andersonii.AAC.1